MSVFKEWCNKIKIIVSEIDGIVTEHLFGIGEMNITMFKQYYMKDFEAINQIKSNCNFVFLSSDAAINLSLCRKRSIPFYHAERNKKDVLVQILRRYNCTPENLLYIGCSYSDIDCMKLAEISLCPEDAVYRMFLFGY
jgi:3-deoxy-D-manno-octulosonate 8-phosphate phosphatase (KDO 8-P phosphatase)